MDFDEIDRRLAEPWPCTESGWTVGGYSRPIWTPMGFLRRGQAYGLRCRRCDVARPAPLQALVDRGDGDRPMHVFKWRCQACDSREIGIELGPEPARA